MRLDLPDRDAWDTTKVPGLETCCVLCSHPAHRLRARRRWKGGLPLAGNFPSKTLRSGTVQDSRNPCKLQRCKEPGYRVLCTKTRKSHPRPCIRSTGRSNPTWSCRQVCTSYSLNFEREFVVWPHAQVQRCVSYTSERPRKVPSFLLDNNALTSTCPPAR